MYSTNFRNLFHLHWQKITLLVVNLLIFNKLTTNAQIVTRTNQADYDNKLIKFGYFLGIPVTHFNVEFNHSYVLPTNNLISITSPNTVGLKMGGVMNVLLNDYFDFRFQPTVSIYERRLEFKYNGTPPNGFQESTSRQTAWFEIPAHIKYKSERRGNVRMYVFGGFAYAIETNAVNRQNKKQFTTTSSELRVDYGVGLEMFKEYFKFAPELHFSHGISNLKDNSYSANNQLTDVSKLTTHTVTLCFLFE